MWTGIGPEIMTGKSGSPMGDPHHQHGSNGSALIATRQWKGYRTCSILSLGLSEFTLAVTLRNSGISEVYGVFSTGRRTDHTSRKGEATSHHRDCRVSDCSMDNRLQYSHHHRHRHSPLNQKARQTVSICNDTTSRTKYSSASQSTTYG